MSKFLSFILGLFVGGGAMFFYINNKLAVDLNEEDRPADITEITYMEKPGNCIGKNMFQVKDVIDEHSAIAEEIIGDEELGLFYGTELRVYLHDENEFYYQNQVIKIPSGKCMRQVGVYKYQNNSEILTIPVGKILPK